MSNPRMQIATVDEDTIEKIKDLEKDMGLCILALEPKYPLAPLSPEQMGRIQKLEQELDIVLLAYKP